jgi:hypothetical protein
MGVFSDLYLGITLIHLTNCEQRVTEIQPNTRVT